MIYIGFYPEVQAYLTPGVRGVGLNVGMEFNLLD